MSLSTELRRIYHLDDVAPEHPIRRAADEIDRLHAERAEMLAKVKPLLEQVPFIESASEQMAGFCSEMGAILDGVLDLFETTPELRTHPDMPAIREMVQEVKAKIASMQAGAR
ncbi:MAG: hypothetical protein O9345_16270 [Burkholderiaceae bacterium]|nr:hypothetical protein [Burkholderiales bacterium]MCZ8339682.1 hypothetical protein [Burkholderiaceae bacterium]